MLTKFLAKTFFYIYKYCTFDIKVEKEIQFMVQA